MKTSTDSRPRTHRQLDPAWSGRVTRLGESDAEVELATTGAMRADEQGLVHGGFVFSLADHAAMVAVDEPTVVLAAADVRFTAPVRVGDRLLAEARVEWREGRRRRVAVTVRRGDETVLTGSFNCYVPERHVLAPREG